VSGECGLQSAKIFLLSAESVEYRQCGWCSCGAYDALVGVFRVSSSAFVVSCGALDLFFDQVLLFLNFVAMHFACYFSFLAIYVFVEVSFYILRNLILFHFPMDYKHCFYRL